MYFVRIIDENGLFVRDDFVDELTEFTVEAPIPDGMYAVPGVTPKRDKENGVWVEAVSAPTPTTTTPEPTTEERLASVEAAITALMGV